MLDLNQCLNTAKSAALLAGKFLVNAKGKSLEAMLAYFEDLAGESARKEIELPASRSPEATPEATMV